MGHESVCPVCSGSSSRLRFEVGAYRIRCCAACAHGYVSPVPSVRELEELYRHQAEDSLYANGVANQVADYLDARPERFLSYYEERFASIQKSGCGLDASILDFGCTNGAFVTALQKAGYVNVRGYDIAEDLVEEGRTRWGVDLACHDLETYLEPLRGQLDVIYSMNVLEHLPDPAATLRQLKAALKPRGTMVLTVPNTDSLQVRLSGKRSPIIAPPHHLQYFSPGSLAALVEGLGFEVISLDTPFWGIETDTYLTLHGFPRWLGKGLRHVMAIPGVVIRRFHLGGEITLVARRTPVSGS